MTATAMKATESLLERGFASQNQDRRFERGGHPQQKTVSRAIRLLGQFVPRMLKQPHPASCLGRQEKK